MKWAETADSEDWLLRPVLEGFCSYVDLKNGSIDLVDIARMNDMIDVKQENERLYRKANEE